MQYVYCTILTILCCLHQANETHLPTKVQAGPKKCRQAGQQINKLLYKNQNIQRGQPAKCHAVT